MYRTLLLLVPSAGGVKSRRDRATPLHLSNTLAYLSAFAQPVQSITCTCLICVGKVVSGRPGSQKMKALRVRRQTKPPAPQESLSLSSCGDSKV